MKPASLLLFILVFFTIGATAAPTSADQAVQEFFKDKTKIENPFDLRDPFKSPPTNNIRKSQPGGKFIVSPEDILATMAVHDIKVIGVLIGKERRAVLRVEKGAPIVIKEGTKIGPDKVEVKAILPGGIILVEKMVNVYGQEEYLETVIPISK